MITWNEYHDHVRKGIAEIGRANPDIVRGYRTLGEAGKKGDLLGAKIRELIALAASLSIRRQYCKMVQPQRRSWRHWASPLP